MQTFNQAVTDFGIIANHIPDDGVIYRYPTYDKPRSLNGWAVLFEGAEGGVYGDWQTGEQCNWQADYADPVRLKKSREDFKIKQEKAYEEAAQEANKLWNNYDLEGESLYLTRKKVKAHGIRFNNGLIIVPCLRDNKIVTLQTIYPDGFKSFMSGGGFKGSSFVIQGDNSRIIICEGYATGASIYEATGFTVVIAFNAGNIPNVAKNYKGKPVTIACDNDANGVSVKFAKKTEFPHIMPKEVGKDFNDIARDIPSYFFDLSPAFSLKHYLEDKSPIPVDLISPRILTPNGLMVFGGAPKVGKSDFLVNMLVAMAGGQQFMGMTPAKPLRIFYLQAEVEYHYLRERLKCIENVGSEAENNLFITPHLKMILNSDGVQRIARTINAHFKDGIDIIAIDPLRNVFDGENENDNNSMMTFLRERIELLKELTGNPAVIIAHHTKKISKEALVEDPFQSLSGASALRGYYTTGIIMYRPEETCSERRITFELRNGAKIDDKNIDKIEGRWCQIDKESSRLVGQHHGERLDAERLRKRDAILNIIATEAEEKGLLYTSRQFRETFEGRDGLGGNTTIRDRISVLATKGYIKFRSINATHGVKNELIIEGMQLLDTITGELLPVSATHCKSKTNGRIVEDPNPDTWIYEN